VSIPLRGKESVVVGDLRKLRVPHPYVAMVPQWDLLDLLAEAGKDEPTFTLAMNTEATGLIRRSGRVVGVRYRDTAGDGELFADLTVACDGRWSMARREAALPVKEFSVPFDAWWFRLPRDPGEGKATIAPYIASRQLAVVIPREGYFQIAYIAKKGTDAQLRAAGIENFRRNIAEIGSWSKDKVDALASMDDVKHLDVRVNRLRRWHTDGLLCIGDAAHAMSPVGGVGINLAVQDAVATARLLAKPLRHKDIRRHDLARIRASRWAATVLVQGAQLAMHRGLILPTLEGRRGGPPRALLFALRRLPGITHAFAYLAGVGIRPEHAPDFARRPAN
ncbi:MAG: FAD-dependent oxidoreductase, partial [Sciscionella sp.]|nr:FAD-dependent oxidoreductase [Sciscionella sp.]